MGLDKRRSVSILTPVSSLLIFLTRVWTCSFARIAGRFVPGATGGGGLLVFLSSIFEVTGYEQSCMMLSD